MSRTAQKTTQTTTHREGFLRRRGARMVLTALIALAGAAIGILLVPATPVTIGPLEASVKLRPALEPSTVILLPPVGEVSFETHRAPVRIEARIAGVDITGAQKLLGSKNALGELEKTGPDAITAAAAQNALLNALFAAAGAGIAVGLAQRRARRALISAGTAAGVVLGSVGLVSATFQPGSLRQPHFEGLLSQAAYVADLGQGRAADYASYRRTLAEFVGQVSALYIASDRLPGQIDPHDLITVLHVSDIHDNPQAYDVIRQLDHQFAIDLVIDTGDLVSWGTPWENDLASEIGTLGVPYVFIKGNHDGAATAKAVAAQPNAHVLDNEVANVAGLEIAGIGDPRFAADDDSDAGGWQAGKDAIAASAQELATTIDEHNAEDPDHPVDIALIHDPTVPTNLEGHTELVLSGHIHKSEVKIDRDGSGTDWFTVGSTGGALGSGGVRPVLDGGEPLDLTARMMYFDRTTKQLIAYDDIVMGGLGLVSVSIQRHQMPETSAALHIPRGAQDGEPIPSDLQQAPGEELPDSNRVTPPSPASPVPAPSDGG